MTNLGKLYWEAVQWILQYLRGMSSTSLCFKRCELKLQGFVDSDFRGDKNTQRNTIGYIYILGGIVVSWLSQLQPIVALSTTEVEYIVLTETNKEMIWLKIFLKN